VIVFFEIIRYLTFVMRSNGGVVLLIMTKRLSLAWASVAVMVSLALGQSSAFADNPSHSFLAPEFQEIRGYVSTEARLYPQRAALAGQSQHQASIAAEPEYYVEWGDYTSLTIAPFARIDSADSRRTHFDMREFLLRMVPGNWELALGFGKVFWGVAESKHLVDIVNQTDTIESLDGEDKFGQPMFNFSFSYDWGFVDFFVMPYFRERIFPSRSGRLRSAVLVDGGQSRFRSGAGRWHPDFAVRYSNNIGSWDLGVSHFYGTNREPTLSSVGLSSDGAVVFIPEYELINQPSIDLQYTHGAWLWKLESLFRQGQKNTLGREQNYYSFIGGFEYNKFGILETNLDLGLLIEYMRDSRLNKSTDSLQHDVFSGVRLTFNDEADTQALGGVIQDLQGSTRQFVVEASRRINDSVRASLELQIVSSVERGDIFSDLREDDFLRFEIAYYY